MSLETLLKDKARKLGFNLIGLTPAAPSPHLDAYLNWIAQGYHGAMGYLARPDRIARRRDLNVILPGVQSIVMVGLDYAALNIPESALTDPTRGRISNYAWGLDYHDIMTPRLQLLAEWLGGTARVYVDTGAVLERGHAQQAGLGFIGKNAMLIHPRRGSYLFLGEILTTHAFDEYDVPHRASMCGSCTRCLKACPTDALPAPYVLDARRCISYLTIELKNAIPAEMRSLMGNWIYGCDICQEVCPFVRRFTEQSREEAFFPLDIDRAAPPLRAVLALTTADFHTIYGGSPIKRIGYDRFLRNVCIAAANSGDASLRPLLERIAARSDEIPLASEHARWALDVVS